MTIHAFPGPMAVLPVASAVEAPVACPSCHTARPVLADVAVVAGGDWRCQRCGERWTGSRLATVAEYNAWNEEYGDGLAARRAKDAVPQR